MDTKKIDQAIKSIKHPVALKHEPGRHPQESHGNRGANANDDLELEPEKVPLNAGGTWGDVYKAYADVKKQVGIIEDADFDVLIDKNAPGPGEREIVEIKTETPELMAELLYKQTGAKGKMGSVVHKLVQLDAGDVRFVTKGKGGETEYRVLGPYTPSRNYLFSIDYYGGKVPYGTTVPRQLAHIIRSRR